MKSLANLEEMKNNFSDICLVDDKGITYKSEFDRYINILEHFYISKSDGLKQIEITLSDWDVEAKKIIVNTLIEKLTNVREFEQKELLKLI